MPKPDYRKFNWCPKCELNFGKLIYKCPIDGRKLRTKPHSGIRNRKYLEDKKRL